MILFIASTRYTLFNIINYMLNVNEGEIADLIITDKTPGLYEYYENIKSTNLFRKVYYIEILSFPQYSPIGRKENQDILLRAETIIPNFLDINMLEYTKLFLCDFSIFDKLLFALNTKMDIYILEEGIGTFLNDHMENGSKNTFNYNYHDIYTNLVAIYAYNPDLIAYDIYFEKRLLPQINKKNIKQVKIFNQIFDFKIKSKLPKYIFIEQCFRSYDISCNDIKFIEELSMIVDENDLYVKYHPKTLLDDTVNIKSVEIPEFDNIPFELIILNYDLKNHILISVQSSAILSPSLVFGENLNIIFIYEAIKGSFLRLNHVMPFYKYINTFLEQKESSNSLVPKSLNNYKKIIKQFNSDIPKDYINKIQVVYLGFDIPDLDSKNLSVSIISLLTQIDTFDFFDIYIFINEDFLKENKELILSLKDDFSECEITFITLENKLSITDLLDKVENIGLFLAETLPNVNRCIYLTSNVIAGDDFYELYDDVVDVEKVYVAGVVNPNFITNQEEVTIDISNIDTNVLIFNLNLIREDNSSKKLNFKDNFKQLDIKYNIMTSNFINERILKYKGKISINPTLARVFNMEEINYAIRNHVAINFSSEDKPWENIFSSFSEIWWSNYYLSPYRKQIIVKVLKPKVSIILPVCDMESCIHECLDTLTNQTLQEIEIICINDGSTDKTIHILNEYAKYDKRISIIEQEQLGFGIARNKSLEIISGEYALFLNSNICLSFDMCETTFEVAKTKNVDILVCNYQMYNDFNGKFDDMYITRINNNEFYSYKDTPNGIFSNLGEHLWNKLIKVDLFKDNNVKFEELQIYDNLYFNSILLIFARKIMIYNEFKIIYRTQLTEFKLSILEQYPLDYYNSELALMNKLKEIGVYETVKQGFLNKLLSTLFINLNRIKEIESIELIYNKIKNDLDSDFEINQNSSNYYAKGLYQNYSMIKNNELNAYLNFRGLI